LPCDLDLWPLDIKTGPVVRLYVTWATFTLILNFLNFVFELPSGGHGTDRQTDRRMQARVTKACSKCSYQRFLRNPQGAQSSALIYAMNHPAHVEIWHIILSDMNRPIIPIFPSLTRKTVIVRKFSWFLTKCGPVPLTIETLSVRYSS